MVQPLLLPLLTAVSGAVAAGQEKNENRMSYELASADQ